MSECCGCSDYDPSRLRDQTYRRVLWTVLAINLAMFGIEIGGGVAAGSVSLQADALDFLSDSANYAITLWVVGAAQRLRSSAALAKGATMALFGAYFFFSAVWRLFQDSVPEASTMGVIGFLALVANGVCAALLFAHRSGDSNMESIWLCSRNDAIGNVAVLLAALGVFGTGAGWPDAIVASIMAALAAQGAWRILRRACGELREARA